MNATTQRLQPRMIRYRLVTRADQQPDQNHGYSASVAPGSRLDEIALDARLISATPENIEIREH